ncbi:MAG: deoxyuridine 5-triphosphate nucleotidohydrolase [Bacillota bacterium]|nr:deoxyuridine 5-triphosphate nucleotidohydrolase [Bacillota bacterium]
MKVKIKKLKETAIIPSRGSEYAAGYDLFANLDSPLEIPAQTTAKIGTGLSVSIPEGFFGGVFARSGLASKQGLRPSNCVGCVDSDYRGELIVALYNDSEESRIIRPNDRIAQLVVIPFLAVEFEETDELDETIRGEKGFGSTGI